MVYTVTLNPAIDYLICPESFQKGDIHRFAGGSFLAGGKGINVSLLLSSLGVRNKATGLCAGFSGEEILRQLEAAGCETDFVKLETGVSRINVKIRTKDGEETDFNGDGPKVTSRELSLLIDKLRDLRDADLLVLAGSLPSSLGKTGYAELLKELAPTGVKAVVDASGESLRAALSYRPFLVKPNEEELGELFGVEIHDVGSAKEYALRLLDLGARNVVVSMGGRGALLVGENGESLFCRSAKGEVVSTVGAGDSLVAGFLYGLSLHGTLEGGLRWGVCAGGATAFTRGIASAEAVKALYPKVGNPYPV